MLRFVQVVAFALLVALASGCGASANRGLIEGKWKFLGDRPEDAHLRDVILFFGPDGKVTLELLHTESIWHKEGKGRIRTDWRYKLLAGDAVDFYELHADSTSRRGLFKAKTGVLRVTAKIELTQGPKYEERTMTLTDADGQAYRLVWTGQFLED